MREIKFRAWDERAKVMHHDFQFVKSGEKQDDWIVFCSDIQPMIGSWRQNPFFRKQLKIMQFTGLHDQNGKEIYEGDILKIENATAIVTFWDVPPEFGLDYYHNENEWCEDWNLSDDSGKMEIIGNIHQNAELLKEIT